MTDQVHVFNMVTTLEEYYACDYLYLSSTKINIFLNKTAKEIPVYQCVKHDKIYFFSPVLLLNTFRLIEFHENIYSWENRLWNYYEKIIISTIEMIHNEKER